MKVIGYVRVSTDRQEASPEVQRDAIRAWCEREGAELVAIHEDIGVSGGTALEGRPGLLAALDALPRGGTLLASKRDRIARDVLCAAMVERLVARRGARLATVDGVGEGDAPEARLMRQLVDVFAEFERHVIRGRTRAALDHKRARGERTGTVRYGFRLAEDRRTLVEEPTERANVRRAEELRTAGISLRAIAETLNGEGRTTRRGRPWSFHDVQRVLDPSRARDRARAYRDRRAARGGVAA